MEELKTVLNTMLKNLGVAELTELNPTLSLRDDLEIDSISYAELVVNLEDKFGINVNAQGRADTLGDILTRLSIQH